VSQYCRVMARELQTLPHYQPLIDERFIENFSMASALHDIGKVGIPDGILLKPDELTREEFDTMKIHTQIGADALRKVDQRYPGNVLIRMAIEIAENHHERWDGHGYPKQLAGEAIPFVARIVALVDVYDALTSTRPYKPSYSHAQCCEIIAAERAKHFDSEIVDCFLKVEPSFAAIRAGA
jgi:putative two-component system response regulator